MSGILWSGEFKGAAMLRSCNSVMDHLSGTHKTHDSISCTAKTNQYYWFPFVLKYFTLSSVRLFVPLNGAVLLVIDVCDQTLTSARCSYTAETTELSQRGVWSGSVKELEMKP